MWAVLRDLLVVPLLLWMAPLTGDDSAGGRGHGWAAGKCVDERDVVKTCRAPRTAADSFDGGGRDYIF